MIHRLMARDFLGCILIARAGRVLVPSLIDDVGIAFNCGNRVRREDLQDFLRKARAESKGCFNQCMGVE